MVSPIKKWLTRKLFHFQRRGKARQFREWRKNSLPSWTENARTLEDIKRTYNVDLVDIVRASGKKPRVFDAGAGLLKVSIGLKESLGSNVFVEALTLVCPRPMTAKEKEKEEGQKRYVREHGSVSLLRKLEKYDAGLEHALRNKHLVDKVSISTLEKYSPNGSFDVIVDLFGPAQHGNRKKVWRKYLALSKPGSVILTNSLPERRAAKFFRVQQIGKNLKASMACF